MKAERLITSLKHQLSPAGKFIVGLLVLIVLGMGIFFLRSDQPLQPESALYHGSPEPLTLEMSFGSLPLPDARIAGMKIYNTECIAKPDEIQYGTRFLKSEACRITIKIDLEAPRIEKHTKIQLRVVYYNSDGSIATESTTPENLEPSSEYSSFCIDTGWYEPGIWPADIYRVEIYFGKTLAAIGKFEIVDQ